MKGQQGVQTTQWRVYNPLCKWRTWVHELWARHSSCNGILHALLKAVVILAGCKGCNCLGVESCLHVVAADDLSESCWYGFVTHIAWGLLSSPDSVQFGYNQVFPGVQSVLWKRQKCTYCRTIVWLSLSDPLRIRPSFAGTKVLILCLESSIACLVVHRLPASWKTLTWQGSDPTLVTVNIANSATTSVSLVVQMSLQPACANTYLQAICPHKQRSLIKSRQSILWPRPYRSKKGGQKARPNVASRAAHLLLTLGCGQGKRSKTFASFGTR